MTVHTGNETDMRSFEGALEGEFCHILDEDDHTLCGAPKRPNGDHMGTVGAMCHGCGRRNCPDCLYEDGI